MSSAGELIANTYNLYVDSERVGEHDAGFGDDFTLTLGANAINCSQGQYIRMTLNSFNMYTNFQSVNNNNNQLIMRDASGSSPVKMAVGNYSTKNEVALGMARAVLQGFVNIAVASGVMSAADANATIDIANEATTIPAHSPTTPFGLQPPPAGSASDTISFRLQFVDSTSTPAVPVIIPIPNSPITPATATGNGLIQMMQQDAVPGAVLAFTGGESYALLGGNKIRDNTDTITGSVNVDISTNFIDVQCYYPAQTSTCPYVYIRSDLQNTGVESANFDQPSAISINSTINSNILGRVAISNNFAQYEAMVDREYFLNIQSKHISQIRFFLTDNHNRPFGRGTGQFNQETAGGAIDTDTGLFYGTKQSTLGNLFFTAVVRLDVVQQRQVKELQTPYPMNKIPARKVSNVLNPMDENYKASLYDAPAPIPYVAQPGRQNPLTPANNPQLAKQLGVPIRPGPHAPANQVNVGPQ
jgi:hypothetical protein